MTSVPRRRILCCAFVGPLLVAGVVSGSEAADQFAEPVDVTFTAACDGSEEKYVLLLPEGMTRDSTASLMIALHGHGSDRWQYAANEIDVCRAARDVALRYNMIYVSPDYRAKTSWMGPKAEADTVQILEELKRQYNIEKTILVGASMGGSSTLTFTAMHPDLIDGAVAINGTANHLEYENYQDAIRASFGGTKQEVPDQYKRRSGEYWPEAFTMPVAITTGGKDKAVPPESCQRLSKILKIFNPDVLHIHRPETGHTTSYEDAVTAYEYVCERVLGGE